MRFRFCQGYLYPEKERVFLNKSEFSPRRDSARRTGLFHSRSLISSEEKCLAQKEMIEEKDWDYLMILDSCRHDYFLRV